MNKLYVPNKLRNIAIERICIDFIYLRNYYKQNKLKFFDTSMHTILKIDMEDNITIYPSEDGKADLVTFEFGLEYSKSFYEVIIEVIKV